MSQHKNADENATAAAARQLLGARYGDADIRIGVPDFNETVATVLSHRSVRAFTPQALREGTLALLVAAAQSAPTSSNLQVWSVIAVEEAERKARLAKLARNQQQINEAPLLLVFLSDLSRLSRVAAAKTERIEGLEYLDTALMGFIDAALAAQNVVTVAESLGLGTVYIGALRNHPEAVAAELALPSLAAPAFGLAIGHPDPARPTAVKPRLPQSTVLHRETYGTAEEPAAIKRYDEVLQGFQLSQSLAPQPWSSQAVNRLSGPESLSRRDRLREALRTLGFALR
ncbi:NADPH-dependent oxidoreductase [Niveibacterium sp. SC-1]|uniref:NADPH-dependent oxidoreductase n=1 Tax=Niveibacterium sp. SC-1 TaxID=3135646 RepID=UPI00311E5113